MGIINDPEDLERHSVQDEETLPLYSELGTKEPTEVPGLEASPDEVRDFFQALLISKRQDSLEDAEKVAARWTRGSGRELKSYPPAMFLKIFGSEDGWFLYRETQLIRKQEKPWAKRMRKIVKFTLLAVMLAWELSMVGLGFAVGPDSAWVGLAVIGGLLGMFGLVGATVAACLPETKAEDRIEMELKACMGKMGDAP